jgi:hypothetical protein
MKYTHEELKRKNFAELKKIGDELNVLPEGDRRYRQSWIDAIAGVNPPLLALLEVSPAGEVQAQKPIIEMVEASPGVESLPAQGAIIQAGPYSPGVDVDYIESQLQEPLDECSPEAGDCPWCGAQHGLFVDRDLMERYVIRCLYCNNSKLKTYPGPIRTLAQESVLPSPSKSRGTFCQLAAKPIAHEKARPQLDRAQSVDVHNRGSHPTKSDRDSSGAKTEALGSQEGDRVLAVAGNHQTDRGRVLPDQSIKLVDQAQEPIAQAAENSPGVEVDRVQHPIIEMVETFPAAEVEQAQEAIAPAAKNLPGSRLKTSTAHQLLELFKSSAHIIEDFPGVKTEVTVSESADRTSGQDFL